MYIYIYKIQTIDMTKVILSISLLLMVRIRMTHYVSSAPCSWWIIPDIFMWWSRGSLTRHFWHKATLMIPESLSSTRSHSEFGRKHLMSYWLDWMSDICVCVDWWMLFRFVTRSRTSFWRSKWLSFCTFRFSKMNHCLTEYHNWAVTHQVTIFCLSV